MQSWKENLSKNWRSYILLKDEGQPIYEEDLKKMGIWQKTDILKNDLYLNIKRKNCVLIQGGAFIINGYAYLILWMSTIDILETMSQHKDITGIVGTGNSLYISKDFKKVYSTLSEEETKKRYEIDKTWHKLKYSYEAKLAPLIILNRTFKNIEESRESKINKQANIIVDIWVNFYTKCVKYSGSLKSRLRWKFIKTARTGHCVTNPTLTEKELLFDKEEEIVNLINNFNGKFCLWYLSWSENFAKTVGMVEVQKLDLKDNPSDIIGFSLLKIAQEFYNKNQELYN